MKAYLILGSCFGAIIIVSQFVLTNAAVEPKEAYFNGSSYLRLLTPMPIWSHSAVSIRSCKGGEIISQRYMNHILIISVSSDSVSVSLMTPNAHIDIRVPARLLDNKWHTIEFLHQQGMLNMIIDKQRTLLANSTYNADLLTDQEVKNEAAVLIVGPTYSGCMVHGPGLIFNTSAMTAQMVTFGPCPLAPGSCTANDVLIRVPVDYCLHDPCMQHGVCISREESYECHCNARYSGKNCEVDTGPPCSSNPCKNDGFCEEDNRGDFHCTCATGFTGASCETAVSVHPLCLNNPCLNNGTCKVPSGTNKFDCDCVPGFTGIRCETDWNDCESQPCQNDGYCIDEVGGFKCNCSGTGYSGTLCQNNVDECMFPNTCQNGGICYDTYGSFICECELGYGGDQCEQVINECLSQPCQHEATCMDIRGGKFECFCPSGYTGVFCENGPPCQRDCGPDSECVGGKCLCKQDSSGHCIRNTSSNKLAQSNACNCLNGATCIGTASNFSCICTSGFTGVRCETPMALPLDETCNFSNCPEPMTCVGAKCICPDNVNCASPCSIQPCSNGGTCIIKGSTYYCQCPSGFNGTNCEQNIYECSTSKADPNKCHHGVCINQTGSYKCYCEPGYTGLFCDADVDECLGHPCKNGATCKNLVNNYECVCPPGYEGKDCTNDINECASDPCSHGSTCNDLINDFSCICIPGMTGRYCEIDIDDCESQPCQHNGKCKDELGGFECNCTSTGYTGNLCEINIDECDPSPCINNGSCADRVNDYQCNCVPGYSGKNCEIDINECESSPCQFNGKCYERSNRTLYTMPDRFSVLPPIFSYQFSYENASGYECVCVPGITGKNCEININECEGDPCKNGICNDGVGTFTCECNPGYEGELCETEVDECEKFQPCIHGTCKDQIANYICKCETLWGGKNCSVALTGCLSTPCMNNGTCTPSLENEVYHSFNCSCRDGYQGNTCEKETTLSLIKESLLTVNTSRAEGYDINLRFRTTLPNGILVFGSGFYSYILELVNGRLNLHSSLLNKWEGVFIGSTLNDSKWHKVFVSINSSHLLLSANEETTIYPITSYDNLNVSYTTFPVTYLGGTIPHLSSYLRHLTHAPSSFVGCMEDVVINGQWIFPNELNVNQSLENVASGCPRTNQCDPNPCHSKGHCIDQWHTFSCSCQRPYLGHTCQFNITAATFSHENTSHSTVVVNVAESARRTVRSVFDISMFIKTRQSTGQVFYLGSDPRKTNDGSQSFVSAKLNSGELLVKIQFNGTPEEQPVGGNRLDNGYTHLLQVVRNLTLVQVKINGTEYFRKTLSSTGPLDAEVLYLGGPPPIYDGFDQNATQKDDNGAYFKGIIQDVQVSNGSYPMTVELFPLNERDLVLPPSFGEVILNEKSILKGEISDDMCKSQPCLHNSECQNTWNDFVCICSRGYKGKLCQEIKFCELQTCPGEASCQNLEDGFECITNMTFHGHDMQPLSFEFYQKNITIPKPIDSTIDISYRTKTGGTLLYVQNNEIYFEIAVYKNQVTVQWRLNSDLPETKRFYNDKKDFGWDTIYFRVSDGVLEGGFKGWQDAIDPLPAFSALVDVPSYMELFSGKYIIYLGGIPPVEINSVQKDQDSGSTFKGCLGEARIGGLLLPFFKHETIYPETFIPRPHFRLKSSSPEEGCVLCFQNDCKNGGFCQNASEDYLCTCLPGYELDDCSQNIDECLGANCVNNSTCVDGIATFTCICQPGYEGQHCESEINECLSNPCHNGGECTDLVATYSCACTEEYAGPQCDVLRLVTCENCPCRNDSICIDGYNSTTGNNFTCVCRPGLEGALCDIPFCTLKPCRNGGFCLTTDHVPICQCSFGYNGIFCENDINECESNPCQNGGACHDIIGGYRCLCNGTGFEGNNCEVDINECEYNDCGQKGLCINTRGSFRCDCDSGLCGPKCEVEDPCRASDICLNGGVCIDACTEVPDYSCNCSIGFTGRNCSEMAAFREDGISPTDIAIIVVPIVIGILIIVGIGLTIFLMMARNKRATRGTYSPSAQEYCNPRLEMDNVLKPPPEERLI